MAQSFPNTPDFVTTSEKLVFDNLLSLSDSWHIYSNMQQNVTFYERISRGEVDFLLTHPYFPKAHFPIECAPFVYLLGRFNG